MSGESGTGGLTEHLSVAQLQDLFQELLPAWIQDLDLTVTEATARTITLLMRPSKQVMRFDGILPGQALLALSDTAMVLAIFAAHGGPLPCATVNLNMSFLRATTGGNLLVRCDIVKYGRRVVFLRADISDESDNAVVATANGTYAMPA